jgi:nucleosome binding factor SPN SPT16 subunit
MDFFLNEMSEVLDAEKKMSHRALADRVANKIDDAGFFQKIKASANFDFGQLDWAYPPVVQGSGSYDLRFPPDSDEKNLQPGVILSALGLRYQSYACMVARTYMVNPSKTQEANYKLLQSVHDAVIKALRPDAVLKDVYGKAVDLIKSKKPELEKNFVKNVGWSIGIEAKDPTFVFNAKNTRTLKDGMIVCILTGFSDIEGGQGDSSKKYALAIADTVRITAGDAAVFTKDTPADLDSVSFFFDDEDEPAPKQKPKKDSRSSAIAQNNIKSTRLRAERTANHDAEKEAARRDHQRELHARRQEQGLEKYAKGSGNLNGTEEKKFKRFESYKRDNQFPNHVKDLMIVIDSKAQSIVLPIMGRPVPFHVNTIKSASATPEGEYTSLRINFLSPGQGVGRKDDQPFQDPTAHFVRSLTFRSMDTARMEHVVEQITEMKKEANRRETEKKQMEDVVEQDKLILGMLNILLHARW